MGWCWFVNYTVNDGVCPLLTLGEEAGIFQGFAKDSRNSPPISCDGTVFTEEETP